MIKGFHWIDRFITGGFFVFAVLFFAVIANDLHGAETVIVVFQIWAIVTVVLSAIRLTLEWRMLSWQSRLAKLVFVAAFFAGAFVLLQMMGWL